MASLPSEFGQFVTVLFMAMAIGMDAFSLGIGIGMRGVRLLHIVKISFTVGLFHIIMPLLGMIVGAYVSYMLGDIAIIVGGLLLIMLGAHMIYASLNGDGMLLFDYRTRWGLLLFALMVSIDSFSVGVSMGLFATNMFLVIMLFGFFGGMMSIMGLLLGRKVSHWLGIYGETIGGIILLLFGIKIVV